MSASTVEHTADFIDSPSTEGSGPSFRELPHNLEAEQAILGAVLSNNEAINRVSDFLRAEHFHEPVHKRIYAAVERFLERGIVATPVTLKNHFDNDAALEAIGGAAYLVHIAGLASTIINIKDHASIVYSLSISRELIQIGEDMVNDAYDSNGELRASEQIERSEHKLFTLASEGNSDTNFAHMKQALTDSLRTAEQAIQNQNSVSGTTSGFTDIDNLIGGFHNSDLIILAARPSMGKTALALNLMVNAAKFYHEEYEQKKTNDELGDMTHPRSAGFISLEMSSEQLATRILSLETGINAGNIRRGRLEMNKHNNEFEKLIRANKLLYQLPIFIDDTPALSIAAVRTRARRLKRKHNLSILIVDYLQLLRGVSEMARTNRVQEISEITMGLKAIAKELNIPVIALSQLSRAVEQRPDKRPQLADLRESGSIEQDADQVMFIYREAYYVERDKPAEGSDKMPQWQEDMDKVDRIAEVMFAKNRHGPVDNVTLFFDKHTTRFGNFDAYHQQEG